MKTTLIIPDELMRQLKRRAARRRTTLSDVVADTLLRGLSERVAVDDVPDLPTHRMGRPMVDVADRDALYRAMERP